MTCPTLYRTDDAFADMYAPRISEFVREGLKCNLRPASRDPLKTALIIVDMQWDFVNPKGNLYVPGSQEDLSRLIEFIYSNIESISTIVASLDTHREFQIFYPTWWKYADNGSRPDPFTIVEVSPKGEAVDKATGRLLLPVMKPVWTLGTYLPKLKSQAQKDLVIWPDHCMEGSMGHSLMSALREALAFYSAARHSQVNYLEKGLWPTTEHYGIFAPEVSDPDDPNGGLNTAILDMIAKHDLIYVAGEAKSHCVLETMKQLVSYFSNQPDVIRKIRFLSDCTSSVVHPAVDFEALAQAELAKMQSQGVTLVKSTDPIR